MFSLIIKHYESGTRRFFRQTANGIRRINGDVFDMLVGSSDCRGVSVKEA